MGRRREKCCMASTASPPPVPEEASTSHEAAEVNVQLDKYDFSQRPELWQSAPQEPLPLDLADVLIFDGTYLDIRSKQRSRNDHTVTRAGMFATWLRGLLAEAQPSLAYVVFDSGKPGKGDTARRMLSPEYNRRRETREMRRREREQPGSHDLGYDSAGVAKTPSQDDAPCDEEGHTSGANAQKHPREVSVSIARSLDVQPVIAPEDVEADDCINSLACTFARSFNSELGRAPRVLVVSGDTDMRHVLFPNTAWLCLNPRISKHDPKGRTLVTRQDFLEQYGFGPEQYADYLAIRGRADKGIKGIGISENVARGLIRRHGDLRGIDVAIENGKIGGWHPRVREVLTRENIVQAYRSRKMVRLRRSVPVAGMVRTHWQPRLPSPWKSLRKKHLAKRSGFQKEVWRVLCSMDPSPGFVEEFVIPEAGFSLDWALPETKVAIDVQGPHHDARSATDEESARFNPRSVAKLRQLKKHGWTVLTIGYQEWVACGNDQNRRTLVKKLLASLPPESASRKES